MRSSDVDVLLPFEQELFAGDPPWTAEQFRSELAGVPHTRWYVVAEETGVLVGYAGLSNSGDTSDVQTLAVVHGSQRQGVGTALLDALVAEARRRGAHECCSTFARTTHPPWPSTRGTASSDSARGAATTPTAASTASSSAASCRDQEGLVDVRPTSVRMRRDG
jgi:N-acetylglutamate synthase-like GNAT family acetyltransferase